MKTRTTSGIALATALVLAGAAARAGTLTPAEVAQIESALGITLSAQEQSDLGAIVKPDSTPAWRAAAEARIQAHRKADLQIQVEDANGHPVPNAQVAATLRKNAFKFGGVADVQDLTDAVGNLSSAGQTTAYWQRITTNLFNAVGADNGFKPKITNQHAYLPGFISWANTNNLSVRGHLLMWPGSGAVADLTGGTPGVDYGDHLSTASTSAYAHYNVLGAVQTYGASARGPSDKAALKSVIDAEIAEWAGRWNVYEWDVVNETRDNTLLQKILGYGEEAEWFKIASSNLANPTAKLFINENQIISAKSTALGATYYTSRRNSYFTTIDRLIANNAPIHGIGFQNRYKWEHLDPAVVYSRLDEFATRYPTLQLAGTEFEIKDNGSFIPTEYTRAQMTEETLTIYYSHPQATGLNAWGFMTAANSGLCSYSGSVKLNGLAWYYLHRIRYNTDTNATSGIDGSATINGFKGDYALTVTYNGNDYPATVTLASNQTAVVTLGDVVLDPGPVPVHVWVPLEQWDYAGLPNGAPLSGGLSATGSGLAWPDKAPFGSVSNQMQRWEATGAANESAFSNMATNPYANAATGVYQLSYDVVSASFANTAAIDGKAQFGYGIRDDSQAAIADKNGVVLVRYEDTGGVNKFRLSVSAGTTIQQDIASGSTISNLHIRAVYDLDRAGSPGSFIGYFRIGTGPETAVTNTLASGFVLQSLRQHIQALNGGNLWQPGDTVTIDNIVFSERQLANPPPSPYQGTNVLFIAVDDFKPLLGCYGDSLAITPSIDSLAAAGVAFQNAQCSWAVCGPSRASLMTGLYPEETGVMGFKKMRGNAVDSSKANSVVRPNVVTLQQWFRYHGYRTAATGKINDYRCVGTLDPLTGQVAEDGSSKDDPPSWGDPVDPNNLPSDFFSASTYLQSAAGWDPAGNPSTGAANLPDSSFGDGIICDNGLSLLNNLAAGNTQFFLGVGFKKPHLPFVAPQHYWDLYDRNGFAIAPFQDHPLHEVAYTWNHAAELANYDDIADPTNIPAAKQLELIHGYYACASFIDAQVGRLLDELEALGLHTNTIVVLWGDHGFHLGDHAEWAKHTNLEQAARVPLIVYSPFTGVAGAKPGSPAGFVDIYPTLCELAGLPVPQQPLNQNEDPFAPAAGRALKGKSLVPIMQDPAVSLRTGALTLFSRSGAMGYAYRTERYRYIEWIDGGAVVARELYDYALDPLESVNLAGEPGHAALMLQFSRSMRAEMNDIGLSSSDKATIELQGSPALDTTAGNPMIPITSWSQSGPAIELHWPDAYEQTYTLAFKTNLTDAVWQTEQTGVTGGAVDIEADKEAAFYRIELE